MADSVDLGEYIFLFSFHINEETAHEKKNIFFFFPFPPFHIPRTRGLVSREAQRRIVPNGARKSVCFAYAQTVGGCSICIIAPLLAAGFSKAISLSSSSPML